MTEPLTDAVLRVLATRAADASICPSDVARDVGGAGWRARMDDVRAAMWELEAAGEVVVTQGAERVGRDARGPLRIRRPR